MFKFLIALPVHVIALAILALGLTFAGLGSLLFSLGVWFLGEQYVERLMNGDDKN